ncbi:MAG: helix-turn-helix transcriptional regulator [Planctomycetota bacterium]|nr:helix-turn-helix transcriptional regulator [Planctomycetota bacterium]
MDIVNRVYANPVVPEAHTGVLWIPFEEPYFAHILHTTFRNLGRPSRNARHTHVHDVYHVVLVSKGKGHFVINEQVPVAEPGRLFLTSPGEWHSFGLAEHEDTEYCEVTFEFRTRAGKVLTRPMHEVVAAWTGRPCRAATVVAATADLHLLIMEEIERMARTGFAHEPNYALRMNASLSRVLLALYEHVFSERAASAPEGIPAAFDYIQRHYQEPLALEELARLAGCSANYLSRRFKALYGATPIVYQQRLRMQTAAQLLRTTQYPIKQIAELVGFGDVYFFSRTFRKVLGTPPGRYRKAQDDAEAPIAD